MSHCPASRFKGTANILANTPRNGEGVRADPFAARLGNHGACYADDKAAAAAAKGGGGEVWQRRADR
jgi:hypothetical protein